MSMSFAGRAAQMAMVTFIGVTSGVYIFTPIVDNMKAQVPSRPPCPETPAAPPRPARRHSRFAATVCRPMAWHLWGGK